MKNKLATLKKANTDDEALAACRGQLLTTEKVARESQAVADTIDAATFDLKAVNPRARVERDTQTSAQVLDAIAEHGRAVEAALTKLRRYMVAVPQETD